MTHPPNSYHYQPATDFESQEPEHMYQQNPSMHMSSSYEGGQRGLHHGAPGHPRRNSSLSGHAVSHSSTGHGSSSSGNNSNNMVYYYDWKNFPMVQAPGSFIPSPEEANMHGAHGPMPASSAMPPYHSFAASTNPPYMSSSSSSSPSPSPSQPPQTASAYNSNMVADPALATPSMNAPNFMPGPSPNFNNSMSYNFIPALPPPFSEAYYHSHQRASAIDMRHHGNMGESLPYPTMYPQSASHFPGTMHSSRLASPPAPSYSSSADGDYYSPSLPFHPMMVMSHHGPNMYFQHASRSASPPVAYSTSASPSPSHYSQGSSFACHPLSRPSLPSGNGSGSSLSSSSPRLACRPCIRGHRAPSCKHTDRPLFAIRPRGRPSSQCIHCKEARKTGGIHVKCLCGSNNASPKASASSFGSAASLDMHKSGGMASAEHPLATGSAHTAAFSAQQQHLSVNDSHGISSVKTAASKSALAAVMQSFWSGIHSSENASRSQESDLASESVSYETNLHRRTLSFEATDTVSQKPPENGRVVDMEVSQSRPELVPMQSKCMCSLGMPCLCSSKFEKLPKHAEPASITSSLHQRRKSFQTEHKESHTNQPMDHNSYEYDRLNTFHATATDEQQHSEQDQDEDDDRELSLKFDS